MLQDRARSAPLGAPNDLGTTDDKVFRIAILEAEKGPLPRRCRGVAAVFTCIGLTAAAGVNPQNSKDVEHSTVNGVVEVTRGAPGDDAEAG